MCSSDLFYKGKKLVVINMDPTPKDKSADYLLQGDISKIMDELVEGV